MIFCVEDDKEILGLMLYALNTAGYEAEGFADGAGLWAALEQKKPRLIMLDIMLPGEDGISILKKLRDRGDTGDIPVIMATAKGTEYDKVMGLDLGADDYLAKPFGMMEMISRVRAVLRRTAPNETQRQLRAGELVMDRARHTVQVAGTEVRLTLKEYELLQLLLESPSRVFSREQLLSAVWGANFLGETRTVDVHIGTLRTKLGSAGALIETVRGVGYRLGVRHE